MSILSCVLVCTWIACGADEASSGAPKTSVATHGADPNNAQTHYDPNIYLALASDFTESATVALGSRFTAAAALTPSESQLAFLHDPEQNPNLPTDGTSASLVYKRFSVTLFPTISSQAVASDVHQNQLNNDDGSAALAVMAHGHGAFVPSLISTTSSTSYNVHMFDPRGQPLVVAVNNAFVANSSGSLAAVSSRTGLADWATLLEKAVMKYNAVFAVSHTGGIADAGHIGAEVLLPMFLGSGVSYAFSPGSLSPSQLRQEAVAALANGLLVVGGFAKAVSIGGFLTQTPYGYSVMPPSRPDTMLSVRSPAGSATNSQTGQSDASQDGLIDVPADASWAALVDLRVVAPGVAGTAPVTAPFVPGKVASPGNPR